MFQKVVGLYSRLRGNLHRTGLAVATLLSTAFQFAVLAVIGQIGGAGEVGHYALILAFVTAATVLLASDYRSLALVAAKEGGQSRRLETLRNASSALLLALWVTVSMVTREPLWLGVGLFRLLTGYFDGEMARAQADQQGVRLVSLALALYGGGLGLFCLAGLLTKSASTGFFVVFGVLAVLYLLVRRRGGAPSEVDGLYSMYSGLAIAGFLTFFPQYIVRWFVKDAAGLSAVADFTIDYQIAMLGIPLATAYGQSTLSGAFPTLESARRSISTIFLMSSVYLIIMFVLTEYLSPLVGMAFHGYKGVDANSKVFVYISALGTYVINVAGYISVAMRQKFSQMVANSVFIVVLVGLCWGAACMGGLLWVCAAFATATIVRVCVLMYSIHMNFKRALPAAALR